MKTKPLKEKIINQEPEKWERGYPIFHSAILVDDLVEAVKRLKGEINDVFFGCDDLTGFQGEIINRISQFDPDKVLQAETDGVGQACGIGAIAAVLWASKKSGASRVEILKYGTSGDITGDYDEVVGYVSAVIL